MTPADSARRVLLNRELISEDDEVRATCDRLVTSIVAGADVDHVCELVDAHQLALAYEPETRKTAHMLIQAVREAAK